MFLAAIARLLVMSCTTIGSHVLNNPRLYLASGAVANIDLERFGVEKSSYCSNSKATCIQYLFAEAYQEQDFSDGEYVQYTIHATGNGLENRVAFKRSNEDFNRLRGTAVLVHGFGASKEAMVFTSIYFRALGFDIIALDLFGHGDSDQEFSFGASEHTLYSELLSSLASSSLQQPMIIVGHSMGALPSTKVLALSEHVDGAILLAPMIRFDLAIEQYLAYKNATVHRLFEEKLEDIVNLSMLQRNVDVTQTDITRLLKTVAKPVLLINSDVDSVSPVEYFSDIDNQSINKQVFNSRSHPSMISFSTDDTALVEAWLKQHFYP